MALTFQSTDEYLVEAFKALGDPVRLNIMNRVITSDEVACTDLETSLPVSKSTISYHIKVLSGAGLIKVEKRGRYYFYRARLDLIDEYIPNLRAILSGA
jgi:ArsR family transcriptional regulator, arsenate/arsenite/antimonite-responsive transcriptional repressor